MVKVWSGSELVVRVVVEFRECELERRKKREMKVGSHNESLQFFQKKLHVEQ